MAQRLPPWVWIGATVLACVAGMVNVIGYLGFEHQAISHLTGTTSLLAAAVTQGNWRVATQLFGVVTAFCIGAALSGLILQGRSLQMGRRYGVTLSIESALLALAVPFFLQQQILGAMLAAAACGLQNGMVTTFSGSLVRTTHLSGMFTDIGIGLGHALRGLPLPVRQITLNVSIIGGFFAGGLVGAVLFRAMGYHALLVPAVLTGVTGIGYTVYRHWRLHQSSRAAS